MSELDIFFICVISAGVSLFIVTVGGTSFWVGHQ